MKADGAIRRTSTGAFAASIASVLLVFPCFLFDGDTYNSLLLFSVRVFFFYYFQ